MQFVKKYARIAHYLRTQETRLPYIIRLMAKEDLDQVNEIDHEAFPTQWPPANYRQELQNKIAHYLVECDSTRLLPPPAKHKKAESGFIRHLMPWLKKPTAAPVEPAPQMYITGFAGIWMMAGEGHITNIAVRSACRGRRLGELLLLATIDLGQSLDATFMTLECRASNIVAQSLYNKYGFVEMGVRKGYYLDNHEDAIIMSTETLKSDAYQARLKQLREALQKNPPG
jgi:[ribosomal protein S18]-alanine N-acetyltransferase